MVKIIKKLNKNNTEQNPEKRKLFLKTLFGEEESNVNNDFYKNVEKFLEDEDYKKLSLNNDNMFLEHLLIKNFYF